MPCGDGSIGGSIGLLFGMLAILGVVLLAFLYVRSKVPAKYAHRIKSIITTLSLSNKTKIVRHTGSTHTLTHHRPSVVANVWRRGRGMHFPRRQLRGPCALVRVRQLLGFYQIATKVSTLYEVSLPQDVSDFLDNFSGIISFGMQGIASTPLECMDLGGYLPRLWFWIITPAVLLLVVIFSVLVKACILKRRPKMRPKTPLVAAKLGKSDDDSHAHRFDMADHEETREATLFEQMLPAVLKILFLLYPIVTTAAFDGFPCYQFDHTSFLRSDVTIECGTDAHGGVTALSWIAIFVYPIGIWLFCALLLFRASSAILAGKETQLTRSIAFLFKEYDDTAFFWELMEMARKFLLVGLFVNLQPGTLLQITVAVIVCATYLMVQLQAAPYKNRSDDFTAAAASFSLLMVRRLRTHPTLAPSSLSHAVRAWQVFVCSMLYKVDMLTQTTRIQEAMTDEQETDYIVSGLLLSAILVASVVGSLLFALVLVVAQIIVCRCPSSA